MISLRFQLSVFLRTPTAIKSEIPPNTFKGISSEIPSENPKQVLKNESRHCSKNPCVTFQKDLTLREERVSHCSIGPLVKFSENYPKNCVRIFPVIVKVYNNFGKGVYVNEI